MEWCNREEEARRAIVIAVKKISENDYNGAKKFIIKAKKFCPEIDGLDQVLAMVNVYISASKKIIGESDWYGVLGVDHWADDETVKKQYKRLALLLHPDKNKFNGAEGAFKLVLEAWCVLSDEVKRRFYDQIRSFSNEPNTEMHKAASSSSGMKKTPNKPKTSNVGSSKCNNCKIEEYLSDHNLNKAKFCGLCKYRNRER